MPLVAKLPQKQAYRFISLYGKLQLTQLAEEQLSICEQMCKVLVNESDEQLKTYAEYFLCMQEREKLDTEFFQKLKQPASIDLFVRLRGHEQIIDARQQGRKVFVTSGHFGRLWMVGIGLQRYGISVAALTRDSGEENVQQLPEVEFQYRAKKLKVLQQRFQGPFIVEGGSVRPIYRALDEHVMAMLIDVPYPDEKKSNIEIPFLGKTGHFPVGIAKIARKIDALIFPYFVNESREGLEIEFLPAVEARELSDYEIMSQLIQSLEKQIMAHPEQWWLWPALPLLWKK